jgi:hypothetical protein
MKLVPKAENLTDGKIGQKITILEKLKTRMAECWKKFRQRFRGKGNEE